jgi:hypothetical protein
LVPTVVSLFLIAAGALLTLALSRLLRLGGRLRAIMFGVFALRVAAALALYLISAWRLPIFPDLHLDDGFWRFSVDAFGYHWLGLEVAERFMWGTELPSFRYYGDPDFFIVVGALYRVFGAHPLYLPLINAGLGAVLLAVAHVLGTRLNGERGGAAAMVLVALCPSAYVWSSQVMKDSLVWCLAMLLLLLVATTLERRDRFGALAASWVVFVPVALVLTRLRLYLVPLAATALAAVILLRLFVPGRRGRATTVLRGTAMVAALVGFFVVARGTDTLRLVTPSDPSQGHLRKARYLDSIGETEHATWERLRATGEVPSWPLDATPYEIRRYRLERPTRSEYEAMFGKDRETRNQAYLFRPLNSTGSIVMLGNGWAVLWQLLSLANIATLQRGFSLTFGGGSLPEGSVTEIDYVSGVADLVRAIPQGLAYALWAPFPWQWFAGSGETGAFRQVAGMEVLLLLCLTPWLLRGVIRGLRSRRDSAWLLIAYAGLVAALMGITVTNIGILFRLRLQFLLPLLVIVGAYGVADTAWVRRLLPERQRDAVAA